MFPVPKECIWRKKFVKGYDEEFVKENDKEFVEEYNGEFVKEYDTLYWRLNIFFFIPSHYRLLKDILSF